MVLVSSIRRLSSVVAVIACALVVSACNQQPKQALRLNLEPGRTYMLSFRTTADGTATNPDGSTVEMPGRSEFRLVLHAEETTAEGDTILLVEPLKAAFPLFIRRMGEAFENTSFRMRVTPTGRITGFIGTDEVRNAVRDALAAAPLPDSKQPIDVDVLLEVISDESLTAIIQPILAVWPNVPVSTGDEWTRDDIFNPLIDTTEKTSFTVLSMDGGVATIAMTSTIVPAGNDKIKNISGKSTGEVRVLTADGTIRAFRSTQRLEGTMTNPFTGVASTFKSTAETQAELTAR